MKVVNVGGEIIAVVVVTILICRIIIVDIHRRRQYVISAHLNLLNKARGGSF